MPNQYSVSFCIISMNRLHHLQQTLPKNIEDNIDYSELEFVLLDYNSSDGMEDWVKENMAALIDKGRMVYYRTPTPTVFSHSHAKNMAFKLAKGNIVCNINADNFTGPGFASYINESFSQNENIVLTPIDFYKVNKGHAAPADIYGKVCVKKNDFLQINGFDERMKKYGFEDYDFINRLEMLGLKRTMIGNKSFFGFIPHEEEDRYTLAIDNVSAVYRYSTPSVCHLVCLYKTRHFKKGQLIDFFTFGSTNYRNAFMPKKYLYRYNFQEPGLTEGIWEEYDGHFKLHGNNGDVSILSKEGSNETVKDATDNITYSLLNNARLSQYLVKFLYLYENQSIMEENLFKEQMVANTNGFGQGLVFKNFNTRQPIYI